MNYIFHILTMINIYLILSLSLNILVGYSGLLSICHAAFYGIGAYISAILMTKLGINFFFALPIAIMGSMVLSLLVSIPSVRLKGDYFILTTFAFQIIVFDVLYNWVSLTKGPYGISGIPSPSFLGYLITGPVKYFFFSLIISILCFVFINIVLKAPFGQVLKAIREDETLAHALGKNVTKFKIQAFAVASALAAISGVLFAHYVTYIDPTSFTLDESIFLLSIVLIGGCGNIKGPIFGTFLLVIIPEILRFLGIPDTIAPNIRQIIYGLLLVIFMYFRPQGIAGEYKFE
ncbi:branched-chain amino acid ABC transporter permease [Candidatus Bathyarchaeota archaeon]|nr:MAG: branched-chain amino acid ABC transporter permease [Candidatus Bathyarchaeota archaeon]